jgi:hypothetical protein
VRVAEERGDERKAEKNPLLGELVEGGDVLCTGEIGVGIGTLFDAILELERDFPSLLEEEEISMRSLSSRSSRLLLVDSC